MYNVVILGCGYTGQRVARRFLGHGAIVLATTRDPASLADLAAEGAIVQLLDANSDDPITFPDEALVLHSIPVVEGPKGPIERTPHLLARLTAQPKRIVYLSTTGVYGATRDVDENTLHAANTERERQRIAAEQAVQSGPWSSLILRPAAIYGPGRGIHVSLLTGKFQLAGDGENFVSRIHVDDLASHAEAALLSDLTGAWPVGDDLPCTSREIAEYCAHLLNVPMPSQVPRDLLHETRRADRRVDGSAIRRRLNITLQYPTYKEGIPASLAAA